MSQIIYMFLYFLIVTKLTVTWEDIFKVSASDAASEFCQWVQVGIDVYMSHRKGQIKSHSSPWFQLLVLLP